MAVVVLYVVSNEICQGKALKKVGNYNKPQEMDTEGNVKQDISMYRYIILDPLFYLSTCRTEYFIRHIMEYRCH